MYKVYRVTNDEKTPLVVANKNKEFIAEFWNPEAAAYVAKTMKLEDKEEVSIEYTPTIEEALNTDYFD